MEQNISQKDRQECRKPAFARIHLLFFLLAFFISAGSARTQDIERKIVVKGECFYYTTIDPEFQVATLHIGNISEPLARAKQYTLPGGRSLAEPVNPFSWDICDSMVYLVNFIDHPMNDKNRAIRRFPLSALREWKSPSKDSVSELLIKTTQREPFTLNAPYLSVIRRSPVLSHFFFDGIAFNDTAYYMAIASGGLFCLWNYNGREWKEGKTCPLDTEDYFTLFVYGKNLYLLFDKGQVGQVTQNRFMLLKNAAINRPVKDVVLIINKNDKSVRYIQRNDLKANLSFQNLIALKSSIIF